jgi:hypothetical protein
MSAKFPPRGTPEWWKIRMMTVATVLHERAAGRGIDAAHPDCTLGCGFDCPRCGCWPDDHHCKMYHPDDYPVTCPNGNVIEWFVSYRGPDDERCRDTREFAEREETRVMLASGAWIIREINGIRGFVRASDFLRRFGGQGIAEPCRW